MKNKSQIAPKLSAPKALVIATFGRHALAKDADGKQWQVFSRGKKQNLAVGDMIGLEPSAANQAWVAEIFPRKNLLYRSDAQRTKVFAANLDQVLLMIAPSPPLSPELVLRTWLACATADIELILVLNKIDLLKASTCNLVDQSDKIDQLELRLRQLLPLSPPNQPKLLKVSVKKSPDLTVNILMPQLIHRRTLILGQSGMGKSSLINLLVPEAQALTAEISQALNTGKHTTTHTQIHRLNYGAEVIDSPGFQAFGLAHLENSAIDSAFSYLFETNEKCRFYNCKHISEPGCAVIAAVQKNQKATQWLTFYHQFKAEIRDAKRF